MWVDKDDVFAEDKVREFKQSNPDKRTHIRTLRYVDSPHPSIASTSQLLTQHAQKYMSSDGNNDLAYEYTAGAYDDTTARDEHLDDIQRAIVDAATSYTADQLRRLSDPVLSMSPLLPLTPMQSLSSPDPPLLPHNPSPTPSGNSPSIHPHDSPPKELLLLKLSERTHMKFQSPLPQSLGMKTARAWHQEHLALVRQRFDEKNRRRIAAGHVPVRHPYLTTHTAPAAPDLENTATATPRRQLRTPCPSTPNTHTCPSSNPSDPQSGDI
jgi:hypothetical protein